MDSIKINKSNLILIQDDITQSKTEAIVNAANSTLMGGGGVDGAIHAAGGHEILNECKKIKEKQGYLSPGKAVITTGGKLYAKYVIHTVGPVWRGGTYNEAEILSVCYANCLLLAREKGIKTISFPSISTGVYRFPVEQASEIAIKTVADFLKNNDSIKDVYFILFDLNTYQNYKQSMVNLVL